MKKRLIFGMAAFALLLCACNSNTPSNQSQGVSSSNEPASNTSQAPQKGVEITSITLSTQDSKAYVTVSGKQTNYTTEDFKWAWGLKEQDGDFVNGKENPTADDFKSINFSATNSFSVRYCLTDILNLKSGTLYRIYGGTPETYDDIEFQSNNYGADDATRHYYLRSDKNNSLVYDSVQPISFTKASVVEIAQADLPTGVTNAGAYLKFGGVNSKNLTLEQLNGLNTDGKIAGNFQRVIGDGYSVVTHSDENRYWKIEGSDLFFYCYVGFIEEGEGWMTHFDIVEGNSNANLQFDTTIDGVSYSVGTALYKVYADKNKSGEDNYWGCLGVYRVSSN